MRTRIRSASLRLVAACCAVSLFGLAHPAWSAEGKGAASGGPAGAANRVPGPPPASVNASAPWTERLMGHSKKMEAIAARYEKSVDAVERQKLWAEYQKEMWAGMQLMQQQAGAMMQECATAPTMVKTVVAGGSGAGVPNRPPMTPEARLERMERRIEAMQTMMDRLIDGQIEEDPEAVVE